MIRPLRHWKALFSIYIQDGLAYRASGFIWILTDVATAVTMPLVWAAAARNGMIAGYSQQDFVLYYLCMLLLGCFITSHFMWDVSFEIKEGNFSIYLIRPEPFFSFMFVRNLAWRCVRTALFLPVFGLLILAYGSFLHSAHLHASGVFWISLVLGHVLSFAFVMMMAMLALFTQEATAIFELYYIPMLFLSGQLFPVALLPQWAKSLALMFPFYYTTGLPTEILVGRISSGQALPLIGVQCVWIVVACGLRVVLWRKGLKHYTGVGM